MSDELRAFLDDSGMLTVHGGARGHGLRVVLKIAPDGFAVQLESWDYSELMNVEDLGRWPLTANGCSDSLLRFQNELATL